MECDIIGGLLYRFSDKFILSALEEGEYAIAVDHYLQMLDSLTAHIIADEHWCWFDEFYSQDYTVSHIWDAFIPHFRSGALVGEPLAELESDLKQIEQSEAYQNYGIPSVIPFSDLKNAKMFLGRFGNRSPAFSEMSCPPAGGGRWTLSGGTLGIAISHTTGDLSYMQ